MIFSCIFDTLIGKPERRNRRRKTTSAEKTRARPVEDKPSRQERIRWQAYMLWNADGCPEGRSERYWYQAERVIEHQDRLTDKEDKPGEL